MFRRRGGLVRAAATTAVVAGTAGAVRHRQDEKYARQDQEAYDQQMAQQQAYAQQAAAAAAPAEPDYAAELEQLYEGLRQSNLTNFDVLLTGYVPSAEAVRAVGKIGRDIKFNAGTKPGSFFWGTYNAELVGNC